MRIITVAIFALTLVGVDGIAFSPLTMGRPGDRRHEPKDRAIGTRDRKYQGMCPKDCVCERWVLKRSCGDPNYKVGPGGLGPCGYRHVDPGVNVRLPAPEKTLEGPVPRFTPKPHVVDAQKNITIIDFVTGVRYGGAPEDIRPAASLYVGNRATLEGRELDRGVLRHLGVI